MEKEKGKAEELFIRRKEARKSKELLEKDLRKQYNRTYQDTFFTALFQDKRYALLLFQALHPEKQTLREQDIEIITLKNIFTVDKYNDACILAENRLLVLAEHQSTINRNMPTRLLLYVAEQYGRYLKNKMKLLYGSRIVPLPAPEFYVVYTGSGLISEDLYLKNVFCMQTKEMELHVRIINHKNAKGILKEYIDLVRKIVALIQSGCEKEKAIRAVLDEYSDNQYEISAFIKERGEVFQMIHDEITVEDLLEIRHEDGIFFGRVAGMIKSGRKHCLQDHAIIEDLMEETGYNYVQAEELLRDYDRGVL